MSYQLDIRKVADKVLAQPEIQIAIKQPPAYLNDAYVRDELENRVGEIQTDAAKEITFFESVEEEVNTGRLEFSTQTAPHITVSKWKFGVLVILGAVFVVVWWATEAVTQLSWKSTLIGLMVAMTVAVTFRLLIYYRRQLPLLKRELISKYQLDSADDRLHKAKLAADEAVIHAAGRAAAALINEAQRPFFQYRLFVSRSPADAPPSGQHNTIGLGLSEVLKPANEVATETRAKIVQMIKTLPGASIGLAGPRGVGKSTLLLSLCSAHPLGNDDTVRVYTSAPVDYESRDFLLHIYASVCRAVLEIRGRSRRKRRI